MLRTGLLALLVAATVQDAAVENPKYKLWCGFKPNSSVTYEQPWGKDGKRQEIVKLVEISSEKAVLETLIIENDFKFPLFQTVIPSMLNADHPEYDFARNPDKGEQEFPGVGGGRTKSFWRKSAEGDEEIDVAGKKVKCHWVKMDYELKHTVRKPACEKSGNKTWYSAEIPGMVARLEMIREMPEEKPPQTLVVTRITKEWKKE
jgi:hypothetical protein